jgi:hypothetical protein
VREGKNMIILVPVAGMKEGEDRIHPGSRCLKERRGTSGFILVPDAGMREGNVRVLC